MSPQERDRLRDGFRRWKDMSREERREFRRGFGGGGFGGPFGACGPRMHDEPLQTRGEQGSDERRGV